MKLFVRLDTLWYLFNVVFSILMIQTLMNRTPFVWQKTERIELHLGRWMCSGSFCPQSLPEENKWSTSTSCNRIQSGFKSLNCKGQLRRYNFCLRLPHAISRACTACVMQTIAHNSRHSSYNNCRRILNHVLKSYDIFCDIHDSHKRVVGLIYTKQFVS